MEERQESAAPQPATLKQRALRAVSWNFAGYGLGLVLRLGSNLIMTRLLAPEMFGIIAISTMMTVILSLLADFGLRPSIVQSRRGNDPLFLDTAWVIEILRGVVLCVAMLLLSAGLYLARIAGLFPAESVYASPVLPLVIAVSSLGFAIHGFQSMRVFTAERIFDQKRPMQIALVAQGVGLIVMIALGVISGSIWSIVAGGLITELTAVTLSHTWMRGHVNRFRCDKEALRELLGFGKWIFVSSVVSVLAANGDRVLLGGFVDAHFLGLYAIAVLIVGTIEGGMNRLTNIIGLPALSEIARNEPSRLRDVYYKLRIPIDLLLLFSAGALFAVGQLVIDLLYDPRYSATGGILQILALSLVTTRYAVVNQAYLALGIPRYLATVNIVRLISLYSLVPSLYYLAGTTSAIWGIALHGLITIPFYYAFNARLGLNDVRRELVVLIALPAGFLCGSALNLARSW